VLSGSLPPEGDLRATAKASYLGAEFVPPPDAGPGGDGEAVPELVGEHGDLAAVMGFVGEHVSEHGAAGRPSGRPGTAREFCDAAGGGVGERIGEHVQALRCGLFVSGGSLFDGAAAGIERGGSFEMRRGVFEPVEADVVKVREDGGDGAAGVGFGAGSGRAPGLRVEVGEEELVHRVIDGVGGEEGVAKRTVE
jgi:hypothetical protein